MPRKQKTGAGKGGVHLQTAIAAAYLDEQSKPRGIAFGAMRDIGTATPAEWWRERA